MRHGKSLLGTVPPLRYKGWSTGAIKDRSMWPDHRIQDLFGIELPIIQAPMAGAVGAEMAIVVSEAGGLGSLPCAMLSTDQMRTELGIIRQRTSRPINLNFFCHSPPRADASREA